MNIIRQTMHQLSEVIPSIFSQRSQWSYTFPSWDLHSRSKFRTVGINSEPSELGGSVQNPWKIDGSCKVPLISLFSMADLGT